MLDIQRNHRKLLDIQQNPENIESLQNEYRNLKAENSLLKSELHVTMVKAALMRHYHDTRIPKIDLHSQKTRSIGVNVLLHKLTEDNGEDCVEKIQDLLGRLKYTQPCKIKVPHRLYHENQEFAIPLIVRLTKQSQVKALLRFGPKTDNVEVILQYPT